jgi:hypothetical protein
MSLNQLVLGIDRESHIVENAVDRSVIVLAALLGAHAVLALAMKSSSMLATAHSMITITAALAVAAFGRRLYWIACAAAYLAGAEVLWRMCDAAGPWELSKFGIAAVLLVGHLRMRHYVIYGLLLVPGIIYSAVRMIHMPLLSRLSAHLSGPLALAVCVSFFLNCRLTKQEINRVLLALAIPISSVCFIAAHGTFSRNLRFGSQSLHAAAGDFGPNQVASVLGLAALVLMLYLVRTPTGLWRRLLLSGVTVACLGQSVMTLSRGGIYASIGAFVPAVFFLIGDKKSRKRTLAIVAVAMLLGATIVYPLLDEYTDGAITRRFSEKGMSGREALLNADIEVWLQNPVFGVGVGRSQLFHSHFLMTHNEFARCLSEHGIFGLAAIITLAMIALQRMITCRSMEERALAAALITWSVLFLFVNGMRLAAPSLTFGLAMIAIQPDDEDPSYCHF